MGRLLDQGTGSPQLEVSGRVVPMLACAEGGCGQRVPFHEPNSPELVTRLLGVLDSGGIPVLGHPRWPDALAADALERAGAGRPWEVGALATLLFTSGSTSVPKVVAHTLDAHLAAARASGERTPFGPEHRWLLSLPLCHVGGLSLLFRAVVGGGTLVLPDPGESLAAALVRTRPSHLSLVATQLRDLLGDADATAALGSCDAVLLGGGPAPDELVQRALAAGVPVRRTYGMTEMGSQIATEVAGRVLPLRGVEVRTDAQQQLLVRGGGMFLGYLQDGQIHAPLEDGWFATGDLGLIDSAGGITILGRMDNQFISGGENVQPEAVEATLAAHGIQAVIVAVPDPRFGARSVAFTPGGQAHDAVVEEALPVYARPIAWLPLPDTGGLKPRRGALARLAAERLGRETP